MKFDPSQPTRIFPENKNLIKKFLLIFSIDRYNASCCFQLFTLQIGVILIALIDIISALYFIYSLFYDRTIIGKIQSIFCIVNFLPSIYGILAIKRSREIGVKYYYHWYLLKFFIMLITFALYYIESCSIENYQAKICPNLYFYIFFLFLYGNMEIYFSFIIFSTANLLIIGENILVNNGKEVLEMMNSNKHQAKALSLDSDQQFPAQKMEVSNEAKVQENIEKK